MSRLKRLISEIHHRSLWQVLLIYVGAAWACFELIDTVTDRLVLPVWLPGLAIVLFLLALPVVLATAFVREDGRATVAPAEGAEAEAVTAYDEARRRHRYLTWRNAAAGFVVVLAVWGVVAAGWMLVGGGEASTPAVTAERPSVAALPFANRSGLEEDLYFTDGIHDEILTLLQKIGGLSVRGRTSVMQYRGSEKNLREIGGELNARYILEGGVQRAGETVRINLQLVDTDSDEHVWAETYDRPLTVENLLGVQSEVALRVAETIKAALTADEAERIARRPTDDLEAYQNYILGKARMAAGGTGTLTSHRALEHFAHAVAADSMYAQAWAGLASVYLEYLAAHERPSKRAWDAAARVGGAGTAVDDPEAIDARVLNSEMLRLATQAAQKALALDTALAEGFRVLARIRSAYWFDQVGGERAYLRAIELRPGEAGSLSHYAYHLARLGRASEGVEPAERAAALDPLNLVIRLRVPQVRFFAGLHDRALREIQELADEYPDNHLPLWYFAILQVGTGEYEKAAVMLRRQMSMMLSDNIADETALLGFIFGMTGQPDSAYAALARLDDFETAGVYVSPVVRSWPYIGLGGFDEAFRQLDRAVEERDSWLLNLRIWPMYEPLLSDDRYPELLRRVGLSD